MSVPVKIAGQSAYFLAGNLFTLVVGFALQIYLARTLGADGLGLYGLLEAGVGVMTSLLGFGIAQTALRYIPEHLKKQEFAEVHVLVRKGATALLVSGLLGIALLALALPMIMQQWPDLGRHRSEMFAISALIPLGLLLFFFTQVLRGFLDIRYIVLGGSVLQLSVKAGLSILLIGMGFHVLGYIWAIVLATITALIWMLVGIRRHLRGILPPAGRARVIRPEWKSYARVMYGNTLVNFWAAPLDRFLLGYFAGTAAVGVLMIGKTLYALPGVFLQMFLSVVAPMLAAASAEENHREEVQKIYHLCTDWLVRISLPLVIFLMVFAKPVLGLFGERFASEGLVLLQMLLAAQLFSLVCGPIGNVLNMCGFEKQMFRIMIVSTTVGTVILVIAVPFVGLVGVGLSVLFSVVYPNVAALYVARKQMRFRWWHDRYRQWLWPLVILLVFMLALYPYVSGAVWLAAPLIGAYAVFLGSQWLIYGLGDEDREIYLAVRRKLKPVVQG